MWSPNKRKPVHLAAYVLRNGTATRRQVQVLTAKIDLLRGDEQESVRGYQGKLVRDTGVMFTVVPGEGAWADLQQGAVRSLAPRRCPRDRLRPGQSRLPGRG